MSVVEVDDPQLVILLHFMTPFMSIQPVFESPLARPASIQGSMASQLLIDLLRDRPGSHGMLLVSIEQDGMMINPNDYILAPIHLLIYERQPCLEPVNRAAGAGAILVMMILAEDFVVCQNKTLPFFYMNVFKKTESFPTWISSQKNFMHSLKRLPPKISALYLKEVLLIRFPISPCVTELH